LKRKLVLVLDGMYVISPRSWNEKISSRSGWTNSKRNGPYRMLLALVQFAITLKWKNFSRSGLFDSSSAVPAANLPGAQRLHSKAARTFYLVATLYGLAKQVRRHSWSSVGQCSAAMSATRGCCRRRSLSVPA
jgi:hypothetical protein